MLDREILAGALSGVAGDGGTMVGGALCLGVGVGDGDGDGSGSGSGWIRSTVSKSMARRCHLLLLVNWFCQLGRKRAAG